MRTIVLGIAVLLIGLVSGCTRTVGSRVVTPTTESIVVRVSGGLTPASPPGLDCRDHTAMYTLDRKTHELAWDFCFVQQRGKRLLTADEFRTLEEILVQLKVVESEHLCPTDASEIILTTTGGGGSVTYRNDVCDNRPPLFGDPALMDRLLTLLPKLTA